MSSEFRHNTSLSSPLSLTPKTATHYARPHLERRSARKSRATARGREAMAIRKTVDLFPVSSLDALSRFDYNKSKVRGDSFVTGCRFFLPARRVLTRVFLFVARAGA